MAAQSATPLLKVEGLKQYFKVNKNFTVKAVDDVSFEIYPGETYGLVGESGSGKSTIGRSIIRLYDPTAGKITFDGQDISGRLSHAQNNTLRTQMQMIFQDPMASLNPRKKVEDIIGEGLDIHHMYKTQNERREKVEKILEKVGLAPEHAERYPHQFSGGQRQRVGIARAFALKPKLIICDEPVSALDVSIQAQVLNLLNDLQEETGTAYLFIAHDLSVVQHISDNIGVMYLGNMMEYSDWKTLYDTPYHPYTQSLLSAVPVPDPDVQATRKRIILAGDPPSPIDAPSGCCFHTRCPMACEKCSAERPEFREVDDAGELLEVDLGVVRDVDSAELLDALDHVTGTAERVGGVEFLGASARVAHVSHQVTVQRDDRNGLALRVAAREDDGV